MFGNSAAGAYLEAIQSACAAQAIAVDVAGYRAGAVLDRPQDVLGRYDVVFAKGKAALEAAVVGAAVVLADVRGIGEMVTTANIAALRPLNFGLRALRRQPSVDVVAGELARYDAADATAVSRRRRTGDRRARDARRRTTRSSHAEVLAEREGAVDDPAAELRAASRYLEFLTGPLRQRDLLHAMVGRLLRSRSCRSCCDGERPANGPRHAAAAAPRDARSHLIGVSRAWPPRSAPSRPGPPASRAPSPAPSAAAETPGHFVLAAAMRARRTPGTCDA